MNRKHSQFFLPLLLVPCLLSPLLAQSGTSVMAGVVQSSIMYNDEALQDQFAPEQATGIIVSSEQPYGPIILGGAYLQLGFFQRETALDKTTSETEQTYNYLLAYALYPYPLSSALSVFGGAGIGYAMGGRSESPAGNFSLKADTFNMETALLLGSELALRSNLSIRAFYYIGMSDVAAGLEEKDNYRNLALIGALLIKL